LKDRVLFIGFIKDEDLPALYSQAEAFVNPSLYEGFGIQILEAFACGTKVICSNTTSLPEIGGDTAFYFDPRNSSDMAQKILASLKIPHDMNAGFSQVQKFSWEKSAREILQKIQEILLPLNTPKAKNSST
jgi:alpha-1,3-rhamnosyl/mannosyltransferase